MTARPTNEFNLTAVPSEEMRRLLYYYEQTGNDALILPHAAVTAETVREKQRREDRDFSDYVEHVLASRERVELFHVEMTEIDEKRSELLDRVRAKLRETREELKRLRDAAPEVTLPDGRHVKVYRDFDDVRTEANELVDRTIIKAEAVSNDPWNFSKIQHSAGMEKRISEIETRVAASRENDRIALTKADKGEMSGKDIDKHTTGSRKAFAEEASEFDRLLRETPAFKEKTFHTSVEPTHAFRNAAAGFDSEPPAIPTPDGFKPANAVGASAPALK